MTTLRYSAGTWSTPGSSIETVPEVRTSVPTVYAKEEATESRHVVRAERAAKYWVISIDGVVRTQAKRERDIEVMARDWLALMNEREPESFELEINVQHARAAGGRFLR